MPKSGGTCQLEAKGAGSHGRGPASRSGKAAGAGTPRPQGGQAPGWDKRNGLACALPTAHNRQQRNEEGIYNSLLCETREGTL